jgi:ubiquinone biosynthesis protein UbiJ
MEIRAVNVLAYLSGIFTIITISLPSPFKLYPAIIAALCGVLSTVLFHQPLIKSALDSFFAKFFTLCIAAITVVVAPSISNGIIGNRLWSTPQARAGATIRQSPRPE